MDWPIRDLTHGSEAAAIAAAGGLRVVPAGTDPAEGRGAVEAGVRALELHSSDLSMLSGTAFGVPPRRLGDGRRLWVG